jgi:hypothetical protein
MVEGHPPYIAVIGSGRCSPELYKLAHQVGYYVAQKRAILVCGGLGGVMEAACCGAKEANGQTIGILPHSQREGNPYLDIALPTGLGEARNFLVVKVADSVIAVGGGYGTLSEIGLALKMGKKVVALSSWELSQRGQLDRGLIKADEPYKAVELALGVKG